jgi:hypothetical protein
MLVAAWAGQILVDLVIAVDSGNRLARNSSSDFSFSNLQYGPAPTSHRYRPSSTNRVSRSASDFRSHARISSILVRTNRARLR